MKGRMKGRAKVELFERAHEFGLSSGESSRDAASVPGSS
jgi:hypothetical protein